MLKAALKNMRLSNREAEVAAFVSKGLTNKEVAAELFVTEKTIKFHLTNIYKKLRVKSRAQLIVWAMPHMTIEDKTPAIKDESEILKGPAQFTIPAGNQKVGSA